MMEFLGVLAVLVVFAGIAILIFIEDYILWRLYLIRYNSILLATTPPTNEQLNSDSAYNSNRQSNKQSINKEMATKELNGRADNPKDKDNYRYANKRQYYEPYRFSVGFRHIPYLAKAYRSLIIQRLKSRCQPNANNTLGKEVDLREGQRDRVLPNKNVDKTFLGSLYYTTV